ncbi:GNAT family N-acetyltransferase [Nakamurella flavida]|uniref:GNAT family N-acetyltransferase n=2 Tax=Nakamurella flavida TaxID=363630 RepID=A0A939C3X1_9ACTN|nr:GNAT family N-acetyltransferase [Nakamurella flavida]
MTVPVPGDVRPVRYPQHWEADVLLTDGGAVHLRPSGTGDADAIRAMHGRSSSRTLYLRYFSTIAEISDSQLRVFTDVDHVTAVGLVAELGGQIIAAGTFHRSPAGSGLDPDAAEVAFLVEDSQQGRGLGSLLLEHLAAAAQELGIRRFTAEVLSENQQMVRVFIDAGYAVRREFSSGVLDLVFDIGPTDKSRAVLLAREHRAESRSISRLLNPRSVAVIGASTEPRKLGHAVLVNLLRGGFTGPVYPVNPDALSVQGVRAYPSVTDIPDPVDLAVVAVPAASVSEVVQACREKGVHGLVVMTAGFADASGSTEGGADGGGAAAQRRMVALARASGMRVLGPNCLGLINTDPAVSINATLAPVVPPAGRIGFFCQSGALGIAILADAARRGLGLSSFVSAGNRADVSGNDLLQYWHGDAGTEVVLLYLESFGNPRKFTRLARVLARTKPVIAVKSGRYALAAPGLAATSTPVSDAAVASLFAQSGVLRTTTLAEAFDVAQLLSTQPVPAGGRIAIVGNSTALGVLAYDACVDEGLTVADGVPSDLGVDVTPPDLAAAVRAVAARDDVDAVVVVFVPPVATPGLAHAAALRSAAGEAGVPVVTTFLAVDGLPSQLAVTGPDGGAARGSVPSYGTPERAVAALAHGVRYGTWLARPVGAMVEPDGLDRPAARRSMAGLRGTDDPDRALTDAELSGLLAAYGIVLEPFRAVTGIDEAVTAAQDIGFPVALKSFDETLRHRADRSGVRLGLSSPDHLRAAWAGLAALAGPFLYVQAMAPSDRTEVSTVFSVTADPSFGALVSFGLGGLATELLDDRAYRAVPLSDTDAADLIAAPRAAPLLDGYRGSRVVDRGPLVDLALRLSALADDLPELVELHLRPVLAGPGGVSVTGATGRIGAPVRLDERRRLT